MTNLDIKGVYVPVVTPFTASDTIDFDMLSKVLDFQLEAGVSGIVACGTTGEYYALTTTERHDVMDHIAQHVAGRARIVAGCNSASTSEVLAFIEVAESQGYDAIMLAAPPTSLPTQRELAAHYATAAAATPLPIILYNYPARAGVEIGFECLDAIADLPGIVAIKESSGDFSRFLHLQRRYSGRIQVMCGSDDQAVDYFQWGVTSWLAGTANVLPRHHVEVMNAAISDDHQLALRLFAKFLPWVQDMESGSYNAKAKMGLAHQGFDCGPVRQPLLPLLADVAQANMAVLEAALASALV